MDISKIALVTIATALALLAPLSAATKRHPAYFNIKKIKAPNIARYRRSRAYPDEEARFKKLTELLDEAEVLLHENALNESFKILKEADRLYGGHPRTKYIRGEILFKLGDYYAALNSFNNGIKRDTRYIANYEGVAKVYAKFRKPTEAVETCLKAYVANTRRHTGTKMLYLAMMYAIENNDSRAQEAYYEEALDNRKKNNVPYLYEAVAEQEYSLGKHQNAVKYFNLAVANINEYSNALFDDEEEYLLSTNERYRIISNDMARIKARVLSAKFDWLITLSDTAIEQGQYNRAISLANEAIKINKTNAKAFERIGRAYFLLEDYNISWDFFAKAVDLDKSSATSYLHFAQMYLLRGESHMAVRILKKGITYSYLKKDLYFYLSKLLSEHNSFYEADAVFKNNVMRFNTISEKEYLEYAKIMINKGEHLKASRALEAAKRANGTNEFIIDALSQINTELLSIQNARYFIDEGNFTNAYTLLKDKKYTGGNEQLRIYVMAKALRLAGSYEQAISLIVQNSVQDNADLLCISEAENMCVGILEKLSETDSESYKIKKNKYENILTHLHNKRTALQTNSAEVKIYLEELILLNEISAAESYLKTLKQNEYSNINIAQYESRIQFEYGKLYYLDNRIEKAKAAFSHALSIDPNMYDAAYFLNELNVEDRARLIIAAESVGDYEKAKVLYEQILEITPYRLKYLMPLSYTYVKTEDYDKAKALAKKNIILFPNSKAGYEVLADVAYYENHFIDALILYNEAALIEPTDESLKIKAGKCYFRLKRYTKALNYFRSIRNINDEDGETMFYIASAYYNLKMFDKAKAYMLQAIEKAKDNPYYHVSMGLIEYETQNLDASLEYFNNALRFNNELEDAMFYKARTLFYLSRYNEALEIMKPLSRKHFTNPLYHYAIGEIYEQKTKDIISDDIARFINFAIIEYTMCVQFCSPIKDDELKIDAERKLKLLEPNFHMLKINTLPAALSGGFVQDKENPFIIYAPLDNSYIVAYDIIKGNVIWKKLVAGRITSSLVYAVGGNIIYGTDEGHFNVLNTKTQEVIFSFRTGAPIASEPVAIFEQEEWKKVVNKIVITSTDGRIYKIEYNSQTEKFNMSFIQKESAFEASAAYYNKRLYYGTKAGVLYSTFYDTGDIEWQLKTGGAIHHKPLIINDAIYVASDDGIIYKVDIETGKVLKKYLYRHSGVRDITYNEGYIFFGDDFGRLHVLNEDLKSAGFEQVNGALSAAPVFVENYIIFASEDSYLYLKTKKQGSDIYKMPMNTSVTKRPLVLTHGLIAVITDSGAVHIIAIRKPFRRGLGQ